MKKSEVNQLFNISRNTIDLWLKRKAETGDFRTFPNQPPGNGYKITDWEKFRGESRSAWRAHPSRDGSTEGGLS